MVGVAVDVLTLWRQAYVPQDGCVPCLGLGLGFLTTDKTGYATPPITMTPGEPSTICAGRVGCVIQVLA